MKNVCRFDLPSGGVLEIEARKINGIETHGDSTSCVCVQVGGFFYRVDHTLEEAQAIWDAAKPPTVAPEKRQSLLDAAKAIYDAFTWYDSKEGYEWWEEVRGRIVDLGRGEPL